MFFSISKAIGRFAKGQHPKRFDQKAALRRGHELLSDPPPGQPGPVGAAMPHLCFVTVRERQSLAFFCLTFSVISPALIKRRLGLGRLNSQFTSRCVLQTQFLGNKREYVFFFPPHHDHRQYVHDGLCERWLQIRSRKLRRIDVRDIWLK